MDLTTEAGGRTSTHVVQLYDGPADLTSTVVEFLTGGFRSGDAAVVIATPDHRRSFLAGLETAGIDPGDPSLTVLDAAATLDRFMVGDRPDPERFDDTVGALIQATVAGGRRVRAYGEMVTVLWQEGLVTAAIELEDLWNQLLDRQRLALLCAYPTELVGEGAAHVCDHHDVVLTARTFDRDMHAPRAARRFVTWALESCERHDAVPATALIVSELATNAVRHAGSSFTVTVKLGGPAGVRVAVRDGSAAAPNRRVAHELAESGRGLQLVSELATAWGTDVDRAGKVVWAEIAG